MTADHAMAAIATAIKAGRKRLGHSQAKAAELICVSVSTLARLEAMAGERAQDGTSLSAKPAGEGVAFWVVARALCLYDLAGEWGVQVGRTVQGDAGQVLQLPDRRPHQEQLSCQ